MIEVCRCQEMEFARDIIHNLIVMATFLPRTKHRFSHDPSSTHSCHVFSYAFIILPYVISMAPGIIFDYRQRHLQVSLSYKYITLP